MRKISVHGNNLPEDASILLDSVFAIAILCIGIAGVSLVFGLNAKISSGSLDGVVAAISLRSSRETQAYREE